jgi:carbon-monoxide dehydrogenase medium subunit
MKPAPFEHVPARSAAEAVDALARHGDDAKILAGGQSLVPMLNMRLARPAVLVDINPAQELAYIREADGMVAVGALARQRQLERWGRDRLPVAAEALRSVGHAAIRNRGTVGGSIAHGDPASEMPALLLCLDGAVVARRRDGERVIACAELYLGPLSTSLAPDELVTEVRFRVPPPGAGWGFVEVARRHGDFALAGAIAVLWRGGDGRVTGARLALFGVGATPVRGAAAETALIGRVPTPEAIEDAARAAAESLSPDGDIHATGDYRRRVAAVLAARALGAALERCRSEARSARSG